MAFRIQDLMTDVMPGRAFHLANDRCTCVISAGGEPQRQIIDSPLETGLPNQLPVEDPDAVEEPALPDEDEEDEMLTLAADLLALKAQLREMGAILRSS